MTPTYRTFARLLMLVASVALLALPTAAFAGGATPQVNWQPAGPQPLDWIERYAAAHSSSILDGRSADTLDAAYNAQQASLVPADGRSPDTIEAASAPRPVVFTEPGGFDWGDAGIGAGFAGGLSIVVTAAATFLLRRHTRQRIQTT